MSFAEVLEAIDAFERETALKPDHLLVPERDMREIEARATARMGVSVGPRGTYVLGCCVHVASVYGPVALASAQLIRRRGRVPR